MAGAVTTVVLLVIMLIFFGSDEISQILSARKSKQLEIEKERTEQKRLDLEIAKANAGTSPLTKG